MQFYLNTIKINIICVHKILKLDQNFILMFGGIYLKIFKFKTTFGLKYRVIVVTFPLIK